MSEEQNAGELMVFGLIEQADRLAKSASLTQATLGKQIEELVSMEARVKTAVQSIHVAVKSLEGERVKMEAERKNLAAVSPTLQQNAVWAIKETLREQGGQIGVEIRREVREALVEPLKEIKAGAGHVRKNVQESKWLISAVVLLFGILLGFGAGQYRVRTGQSRLETQIDGIQGNIDAIEGYLQRQDDQKKAGAHTGKGK